MLWRRIVRDPLTHFLVLGSAAFLLHAVFGPKEKIQVSAQHVEALASAHENREGAPPSRQELDALVEAHVRGRVLEAQGRALGLDKNDPVIGRHVAQKMELLLESEAPEPTQAQLRAHFQANSARYARPTRMSFEHIFAGGEDSEALARALASDARTSKAPLSLGQPFPHGRTFAELTTERATALFGEPFAQELAGLSLSEWAAVQSAHGWHAVRVTARVPARDATFAEARARVEADVRAEARRRAVSEGVAGAMRRFQVEVDVSGP